jgi:hypothetical protein
VATKVNTISSDNCLTNLCSSDVTMIFAINVSNEEILPIFLSQIIYKGINTR